MATLPITPPRPGLEREEPEFATEDDIPSASSDDAEENARETEVQPRPS